MQKQKPKNVNALMKYLRDEKGIKISGSVDKRKLRNMGYYHGYKGYRYIERITNEINYSSFEELDAIYDFDSQLKALLYPHVMFIETALKNRVLEVIIAATKSDSIIDTYNKLLDNYKMYASGSGIAQPRKREERFKQELKKRLDLRTRIYKIQADAFNSGNRIANHYLKQDANIPIWGLFELLSLGEFGYFVSCLNKETRKSISCNLGIRQSDDNNSMLPERIIYAIKDLRNAIAHNDVIFDARFRTNKIDKQVTNMLNNEVGIAGITFDTITDYFIMVVYLLKLMGISKTELRKNISNYKDTAEKLRQKVPVNVFNKVLHTDYNAKLEALRVYVLK